MKNPFGDQQIPGSHQNLKERVYRKVSDNVEEQIRQIMVKAFENALDEESIALSRLERNRLFEQISRMILEDILKKRDAK